MEKNNDQREMNYSRGCIFKKMADKEYAKYKRCIRFNYKDEAQKHYYISQQLYTMYKNAFHRAGYVILS